MNLSKIYSRGSFLFYRNKYPSRLGKEKTMRTCNISPVRRADINRIGEACKKFRKERGITLYEVAKIVCTSIYNVSAFESGRNDSATIYNWYLEMGMKPVETYKYREDYNPFDYKGQDELEDFSNGE